MIFVCFYTLFFFVMQLQVITNCIYKVPNYGRTHTCREIIHIHSQIIYNKTYTLTTNANYSARAAEPQPAHCSDPGGARAFSCQSVPSSILITSVCWSLLYCVDVRDACDSQLFRSVHVSLLIQLSACSLNVTEQCKCLFNFICVLNEVYLGLCSVFCATNNRSCIWTKGIVIYEGNLLHLSHKVMFHILIDSSVICWRVELIRPLLDCSGVF